ncbi:SCO1664 family protein [Propionibacterium sp.]|uniref:SCO1664 family protein n=1 Tax=Propionibacterium sp. TaxID=1977903 RepID=UPI0039EA9731
MTLPDPDVGSGELDLIAPIPTASNGTYLATIEGIPVVYKPVSGEQQLWDFPDGPLAHREMAAYLVSEALGWGVVPRTWLRDGPLGAGMVQLWREPDPEQDPVDLVSSDAVPDKGWRHVLTAQDSRHGTVVLIHEDSPALRRMAVFDVVVNNADRKGGHILAMPDGHRYGVDHGLTFHVQRKLRTVLWGWLGEELDDEEIAGVEHLRLSLGAGLGQALSGLLSAPEIVALDERCQGLLSEHRFPAPDGRMPATPWPLF